MHKMRPGLFEYQIAARMEEIHDMGGCERKAYAPIVGAGLNSTSAALQRTRPTKSKTATLSSSMSAANMVATRRTSPAHCPPTANSRRASAKSTTLSSARRSSYRRDQARRIHYAETPQACSRSPPTTSTRMGATKRGERSVAISFTVSATMSGSTCMIPATAMPLEPGMVITVEPGIYIPEENLGVRIEDDILVTNEGHKVLTEWLPRSAYQVEQIMSQKSKGEAAPN